MRETECSPPKVVQRAAWQTKVLWEVPEILETGTLEKANRHFDLPQAGSGTVPPC